MKSGHSKLVFSAIDQYGGVQVKESSGIRSLYFDNEVIQSSTSLEDPTKPILEYIQGMGLGFYAPIKISNILILGGGGGSLINLARKMHPECHIDVVERSGAVVKAALEAMQMQKDTKIQIHVSDALSFLTSVGTQPKYDLIFIDLFDSDGPALEYSNLEFSSRIVTLLNPKGIVLANLWKHARRSSKLLTDNISSSLGRHGYRWPLPSGLNLIFIAGRMLDYDFLSDWKKTVVASKSDNFSERIVLINSLCHSVIPLSGK